MDNLETLRGCIASLNARDAEFARSLLNQANRRGLSPKQLPWIDTLISRATPAAKAPVGDVSGVLAFMARTKNGKVKVLTSDGLTIRLTIAGQASREPGSINVTSTDRGFDNRLFYGRIARDGTFTPGRNAVPSVVPALVALAADPAGTAAAFGQATGECSFCTSPLTDAPSVAVGYGPVCAKRYGLPWGRTKAAETMLQADELPF